jgi:hypothetical protein
MYGKMETSKIGEVWKLQRMENSCVTLLLQHLLELRLKHVDLSLLSLLVASTTDGNNEILPLALAVVPIEDTENWAWFLENLKDSLWELETREMVVVSDRDKGLQKVVQEVLPDAYHSHCCQHIADNVQTGYGLACQILFWGGLQKHLQKKYLKQR